MIEQSAVVPSRKESLIVIMDNENVQTEKDNFSRDFTPQMRLLHYIVNKICFSNIGRLNFVTQRDLYMMYHVIMKKPTNLSGTIMSQW